MPKLLEMSKIKDIIYRLEVKHRLNQVDGSYTHGFYKFIILHMDHCLCLKYAMIYRLTYETYWLK